LGGRLVFGVGGDCNAEELEDHGTVFSTRFKRMRERIEAMTAIWLDRCLNIMVSSSIFRR
jgi:alkanesulfonate monooxygenase SsuD/methylene tetrahydromethanopterin reductase-like flavin-dependent oxidoreductase (luciferase family)